MQKKNFAQNKTYSDDHFRNNNKKKRKKTTLWNFSLKSFVINEKVFEIYRRMTNMLLDVFSIYKIIYSLILVTRNLKVN